MKYLVAILAGLGFLLPPTAGILTVVGPQRIALGTEYMIAAPTPEAMEAGRAVLEEGGNAVDAAAAAAFALMVTDPLMASVGGRAQILIRRADGTMAGIDGATQAPMRLGDPAEIGHGYRTVPVPGAPAALALMLEEHGSWAWEDVLQPAVRLAEEGFTVKSDVAGALRTYEDRLALYPGTRAHFFKANGLPFAEGDTLRQPALAETLRLLASQGPSALYTGSLADRISQEMDRNGGLVTGDDLAQYRVLDGPVVEGSYRGYTVVARGGNCDGASVIEMLQILEGFDLAEYDITDPEYIHILAQALYLGNADEYVPDWLQVSRAHADRRRLEIDLTRAWPTPIRREILNGETNHLSVVDAQGNAVAITQSIGPNFGSKAASEELGFFFAYSYDMNDDPVPLQREKTSQSPTMVLDEDGPFLVIGSAGSSRIPGSIVRTAVNVIEHGMTLEEALAARRWFIAEDELRIESDGLPLATLRGLGALGYEIREYEGLDGYFARVHAVLVDSEGERLTGGSDPRDLGAAGGR